MNEKNHDEHNAKTHGCCGGKSDDCCQHGGDVNAELHIDDPIGELEAKLAEAEARALRTLADFQNFQKRAANNEVEARRQGITGIISSLLMSFTISLDEFIIAFFLAGNEPTLPTYIFSQLRFPKQIPMIMALGTVLVVMSIFLLTIAEYFRRRGVARTGAKDTGGFL